MVNIHHVGPELPQNQNLPKCTVSNLNCKYSNFKFKKIPNLAHCFHEKKWNGYRRKTCYFHPVNARTNWLPDHKNQISTSTLTFPAFIPVVQIFDEIFWYWDKRIVNFFKLSCSFGEAADNCFDKLVLMCLSKFEKIYPKQWTSTKLNTTIVLETTKIEIICEQLDESSEENDFKVLQKLTEAKMPTEQKLRCFGCSK